MIKNSPFNLFYLFVWLFQGKVYLKDKFICKGNNEKSNIRQVIIIYRKDRADLMASFKSIKI